MYDKLIKQLHYMEDVCKKDISCPVPCINECFFKEVADAIEKLTKERDDWKTTAKLERDGMWEWFEAYQKDVPLWIPVTKRLPDFEGMCLCMRKSYTNGKIRHQEIMYFDFDEQAFCSNVDGIFVADGNVTHWMPLPEPPKEDEHD